MALTMASILLINKNSPISQSRKDSSSGDENDRNTTMIILTLFSLISRYMSNVFLAMLFANAFANMFLIAFSLFSSAG